MANGINGGVVLVFKGADYATKTGLIGQGNLTATYQGQPIEINNKSTDEYRQFLDNATSTKAVDFAVDFTVTPDDADQEQLLSDAFAGTQSDYIFDFGGEYYVAGKFVPSISTETGNKNEAVVASITFLSSGQYNRVKVV